MKTSIKGVIATFIPCMIFWLLLTMSLSPRELRIRGMPLLRSMTISKLRTMKLVKLYLASS